MKIAVLKNNVADMRVDPSHESERVNQVLFGQILRVETVRSRFALVVQEDGYTGWVDKRYIHFITRDEMLSLKAHKRRFVAKKEVSLCDKNGNNTFPYRLYYGTTLYGREQTFGLFKVSYPGIELFVKLGNLVPIKDTVTKIPTRKKIIAEAKKFLGVPYLWGGVTTTGFDCSGFVRAIYSRFGITLPRDTKDQISVGHEIEREQVQVGDLLFFDRHVGISAGNNMVLHASRGAGLICIESLKKGSESYRPDLDNSYEIARRVL